MISLYVLDRERYQPRPTVPSSLFAHAGGQVEVLDGVKAGDAVVEQGAGFLADGDSVRIVEAAAAAASAP